MLDKRSKQFRLNNKKKHNQYCKNYRDRNKEKRKIICMNWVKNNPEKRREIENRYRKNRWKKDLNFNMLCKLRNRLLFTMKKYGNNKQYSSKTYGLDWKACCQKLIEEKPADFNEKNYEIDHIRPLSSFDLTDPEQIRQAFAPENLQWLTAEENLRKGNNYVR